MKRLVVIPVLLLFLSSCAQADDDSLDEAVKAYKKRLGLKPTITTTIDTVYECDHVHRPTDLIWLSRYDEPSSEYVCMVDGGPMPLMIIERRFPKTVFSKDMTQCETFFSETLDNAEGNGWQCEEVR